MILAGDDPTFHLHTDPDFVLMILAPRRHCFFILKSILGFVQSDRTPLLVSQALVPDDVITSQRSPTQVVIRAFGMVIWVISLLSVGDFRYLTMM